MRERVSALLTLLRPPSPAGDVSGPPHRSGDLQDQTCIERFLAQSPTTDAKGAVATSLLETLTDISVSAQRLFFPPRQAGPGTMVDVAIFEHIEATVTKLACKRKAKAKQIKCWGDALANRRRELEALDAGVDQITRRGGMPPVAILSTAVSTRKVINPQRAGRHPDEEEERAREVDSCPSSPRCVPFRITRGPRGVLLDFASSFSREGFQIKFSSPPHARARCLARTQSLSRSPSRGALW